MGMKHKNVDSEKCVFKKHIYNWYPQKDKRRHFVQRQDDKITENKKELPDIKKRMSKIKKKKCRRTELRKKIRIKSFTGRTSKKKKDKKQKETTYQRNITKIFPRLEMSKCTYQEDTLNCKLTN